MKRDMDLVRKLLFEIEKADTFDDFIKIEFEGYTNLEVLYHIILLTEAGYIRSVDVSAAGSPEWYPTSLTWKGHEFLDDARNDTIWNKGKKHVAERVGAVSFEVLKAVLVSIAKDQLNLSS